MSGTIHPVEWEHRTRNYARSLATIADAYRLAAEAPGLGKRAADYLRSEATRLVNEAGNWADFVESNKVARWAAEDAASTTPDSPLGYDGTTDDSSDWSWR